jgi:hypothetical protein
MLIHKGVENLPDNRTILSKIGIVVGSSGYYSEVSGNKWATHKNKNTTTIKN